MKGFIEKLKKLKTSIKISIFVGLFLYVSILALCAIKIDYSVTTPGGVTNATTFLEIDSTDYDNEAGSIYGTYVYSYDRVSIMKYIFAKLSKKSHIEKYEKTIDMTDAEQSLAGQLTMNISSVNAIIAAYTLASETDENIKIEYEYIGETVTQIRHDYLVSGIQIGDIIIEVNGIPCTPYDTYLSTITRDVIIENNYKIPCKVKRGEEVLDLYLDYFMYENKIYRTFYAEDTFKIDEENTYPKFEIKSTAIGGPSAGMMKTFAIYNMLTSEDLTKGLNIAGTGTVELTIDGTTCGLIGSIEQKIYTVSLITNLDIFFVDSGDYEEALTTYNKLKNPSFTLVSVSCLEDILEYLGGLE